MTKKSQAVFLTRKELIAFESLYQALKKYPGFKMENVFTYRTREYYAVSKQAADAIWRNFSGKSSKLLIAIHEAGHAVTMAAIREEIAVVEIFKEPHGSFGGHVMPIDYVKSDEDYEPIETAPLPCKPLIYIELLTNISGFVAENIFTRTHPHQYHEKFLAFVKTRYLDEANKIDPLHHWNFFMKWCERILKANENIFHKITEGLLQHETLPQALLDELYQEVKQESVSLFFN